jgi:monomeric sarcosine oxidase
MKRTKYDVAVIGAGVFGSWCAHFLDRAGLSVVLLDAYGPGNSRASSGGESRITRLGYGGDVIYSQWSARSLGFWRTLSDESRQSLFLQTGMLWMAREGDPQTNATATTLNELGFEFERLERSELESRFPQINFGPITWALFEPQGGVILARRAVQAVVAGLLSQGASYYQEAIVPPTGSGSLDYITTQNGTRILADRFVFACGPWMPQLFPEILTDVIHATRQEVFFFGVPPGDVRFSVPSMPAWIDFQSEFYGVPDVEHRGFKIALDRHGPRIDPNTEERLITGETLALVREHLVERFPALANAPLIESRVCQYENSPNGDFLIDRHPEMDNVWLVGGGSGHGFKHGPAVGEYVASVLTGQGELERRFLLSSMNIGRKRSIY